ncbi:MAG: amidohydrolase family protein [Anaerolineaceae bacterium]|nr:amidohydrolase family protein [Anaerolineaceae bacterium]
MEKQVLIKNIKLLNSACDGWIIGNSVLLEGKRIKEVLPEAATIDSAHGVELVDGQGEYLLPGLIEMHGHFYGRASTAMRSQHLGYCPLYLSSGITTVRTPGEFEPDITYGYKQSIEHGQTIGPRIITGGWYFDKAPSIVGWFRPVNSIEEIEACFDERDKVSDQFKVYSSMPKEWVRKVCELGHAKGKKVYGHLGMCSARDAIEVGLDGLEHGYFTVSEFYKEPSPHVESSALEELDMNSDLVKNVQDQIVTHQIAITPTLLTFMLNGSWFTDWLDHIDAWRYLSPAAKEKQKENRKKWDEDPKSFDQQERLIEKQRVYVNALYKRGAKIFCGTDPSYPMMIPGQALVLEAANLVDCGMSNAAVLRALTIAAATELGIADVTGSISAGKEADLLLVNTDPLQDIHNLDQISLVWKAGHMHKPDALRELAVESLR